jgi:hypothetical protein
MSAGVSRTASGLEEQSMRGLTIGSNLNSTPSSSANCRIAFSSCLLIVSATVFSFSGSFRSSSRWMPRMHFSNEPGMPVSDSYVALVRP